MRPTIAEPVREHLATIRLDDGALLAVRPLGPGDGPALAGAVASLSPRSRYLRFFAAVPRLSPRHLALLLDVDGHAREALVALDPVTESWVGVARWATFPDRPAVADVAVTVADAWQRRGVGRALIARLERRAAAQGIRWAEATTLAENAGALALLRGAGFQVAGREGATVTFRRPIAPAGRRYAGGQRTVAGRRGSCRQSA